MTLAVLGAHVVLTDQEYNLPLLRKNVQVNFATSSESTRVPRVEELQWGEPLQESLVQERHNTDYVVFSDVLYHESAFRLLFASIQELSSSATQVFFSFETRSKQIEHNFLALLAETHVVELLDAVSYVKSDEYEHLDELFVYQASRK